ncbi:MAG: hypothetical protein ACE5FM_02265 [Methyloligellaceae bacterium]
MMAFGRLKSARVFFLIVALVNIGLLAWWWLSQDQILYESGPLENLQAAVLGVAFATFYVHGKKLEGTGRTAAVIFCFICFYVFFKEVDFRELPVPDLVLSITTGRIRKLLFWFFFLLVTVYIISRFTQILKIMPAMLYWRAWPYYLWFALIIFAELAEEVSRTYGNAFGSFAIPYGLLLEEMLEFNAYMVLLFISINFFEFGRFIYERAGGAQQK